jgi:hypothetical protein
MTFSAGERKAYFQEKRQRAARAAGWKTVEQFLTAAGNGQVAFPPCPPGFVPMRAKYRREKAQKRKAK